MTQKIALASDHGGLDLKNALVTYVTAQGYDVLDLGTNTTASVDYPDYANLMARAIKEGKADKGVLICGTGIGISIAVNRHPFIRGALVHDSFGARLCREHNDANVLVLGGRTTGIEVAFECVKLFLTTPFLGDRHARRVAKLSNMS